MPLAKAKLMVRSGQAISLGSQNPISRKNWLSIYVLANVTRLLIKEYGLMIVD